MRDFRREVSAASDFSTEFPETEFSWSLTRHLRFLRCERAYFLHYYAAQGGWDGWADPVISAIYRGEEGETLRGVARRADGCRMESRS